INVAVYGQVPEDQMLTRGAAQPGDVIFTTGFLGDSRAGLHLILDKVPIDRPELKSLLSAHLHPEPHLREGRLLASSGGVRAAIDVSDGLSSDLAHILGESRVGARIQAEKLPISDNLRSYCRRFGKSPVEYALAGGEDYVLLLTAAAERCSDVARVFQATFDRPLYAIGEITDSMSMELVGPGATLTPLTPSGWDHFKGR
ncbi:MAG: thiamine-phosphate kinase, partial [Hyphomicrobiales bacterium]